MTPSRDRSSVVLYAQEGSDSSAMQHEADVFAMLLGWTALGCILFSVIAFLSLLS